MVFGRDLDGRVTTNDTGMGQERNVRRRCLTFSLHPREPMTGWLLGATDRWPVASTKKLNRFKRRSALDGERRFGSYASQLNSRFSVCWEAETHGIRGQRTPYTGVKQAVQRQAAPGRAGAASRSTLPLLGARTFHQTQQ